ncbi:MAG: DNA/RNA non-specific endonuclease [Mariniphaga sp.]
MRQLLILLFLFVFCLSYGQDTIRINHINYTTVFSVSKHYPVVVDWWITRAKLACDKLPRINNFSPDPLLPNATSLAEDYRGGGYDRGHMCDDADNLCQGPIVQSECFYYSNMAPQYPALNRGSWKVLEMDCRSMAIKDDSIHIWAGSVGSSGKIGRVTVPEKCWKVIYLKQKNIWKAYIFKNSKDDWENDNPETTLEEIEQLTGIVFN